MRTFFLLLCNLKAEAARAAAQDRVRAKVALAKARAALVQAKEVIPLAEVIHLEAVTRQAVVIRPEAVTRQAVAIRPEAVTRQVEAAETVATTSSMIELFRS